MNPRKPPQPKVAPLPVDEARRKQRLVELEARYRRTETALQVAQAEHERSFTEIWAFMNESQDTHGPELEFSPDLTFH